MDIKEQKLRKLIRQEIIKELNFTKSGEPFYVTNKQKFHFKKLQMGKELYNFLKSKDAEFADTPEGKEWAAESAAALEDISSEIPQNSDDGEYAHLEEVQTPTFGSYKIKKSIANQLDRTNLLKIKKFLDIAKTFNMKQIKDEPEDGVINIILLNNLADGCFIKLYVQEDDFSEVEVNFDNGMEAGNDSIDEWIRLSYWKQVFS